MLPGVGLLLGVAAPPDEMDPRDELREGGRTAGLGSGGWNGLSLAVSVSASRRPGRKKRSLDGYLTAMLMRSWVVEACPAVRQGPKKSSESELPHYRSVCMLTILCICTRAVVGEAEMACCFDACRSALIEVALCVAA